MAIYTIKCQDGGDRQCKKNIQVNIPITGLTDEQLTDIIEEGSCEITKVQIEENFLKLDKVEKVMLKEKNFIVREYDITKICDACGSDYTRDDDGNIIDF